MKSKPSRSYLALLAFLLTCAGCASHRQHRECIGQAYICPTTDPKHDISTKPIQIVKSDKKELYSLGFIEFDDQGQLWSPEQSKNVLSYMSEQAISNEVLMIVYVHGWKHSAKLGDDNIGVLKDLLESISSQEKALVDIGLTPKNRKIIGLYIGWRGASATREPFKSLSLWNRKKVAHQVGSRGAVSAVFNQLEIIRESRRPDALAPNGENKTRLVIIGHSMGSIVVYEALDKLFVEQFVYSQEPRKNSATRDSFADLVVLVNPALEALKLSDILLNSRAVEKYPEKNSPSLLVLTSESDRATKCFFPLGQVLGTRSEKTRKVERYTSNGSVWEKNKYSQGEQRRKTVGHYQPFKTHDWRMHEQSSASQTEPQSSSQYSFQKAVSNWWLQEDASGKSVSLGDTWIKRTENTVARNPYLVVKVDKRIMDKHGIANANNQYVRDFISSLITLNSLSKDTDNRKAIFNWAEF